MKKQYIIAELVISQELCKPSEDYYRGKSDWSTTEASLIQVVLDSKNEPKFFDSEEEAIEELQQLSTNYYTILPVYIKEETEE